MRKLFVLFIAVCCMIQKDFAQHILLQQNVDRDTIPQKYGPNLKNYRHFFIGYGFIAGTSSARGDAIIYGRSSEFLVGYRYKRKITNFESCGVDLSYHVASYFLKQDSSKILPNNVLHDKEKMVFNSVTWGIYNRINFDKRGNYMGDFLDLGAYADLDFSISHNAKDKHPVANSVGAGSTKVVDRNLVFTNPFNYGLLARVGFNKLVFYGSYRLSDYFNTHYIYPELPRIIIGVQLSFHK